MDKEKYIEDKINKYYKQKTRKNKINDKYNIKSKMNKIIYEYQKLREVRPIYKIINNLSIRINKKLKDLNVEREFTYTQILGCIVKEFEEYLLNKMTEGMTYDNYGEWEVDHIIPFSSFDFHKLDQIKICCNYTNLQPLWKSDNQEKSNKIV